ncbi:nuclear transport factor 2 family protein, partial [Aliarcobacter butzleri]|uniref:nuclear transport factor 2 family protein n=1 Tax=Aliarcobacter butzleri TaxID=28197 RepID=UPI003AF8B3D5
MKELTNKELVKLYYDELWNKHKKEYTDIVFDDNITFHGSLDITVKGKKELEKYMDSMITAIPKLFHSIITMVCEEDNIAVRAL